MTTLELNNLTMRYRDGKQEVLAVDELDLSIDDGEFLVVVGPSGCGKSTTLRAIAGLETVSEGEIRLNGELLNDVKSQHRDIAMVFQSYALYPHMTVRQNMAFGLEESTDLDDTTIAERVEETAGLLDVAELLDRKPAELSGGQRQRIALGRSIVRDPEVFLMDEPLSNLDAKLRAQMRMELQRLQEDLGTTTVYVTHDQTEAMTMGDRIAILNEGRLQQVSTPLECYNRPNNLFVAGFIGDPAMNFFSVRHDDGMLEGDRFSYPVGEAIAERLGQGQQLILGIRPEDISLADDATATDSFDALVDVVEPHGHFNDVHLRFTGEGGRTAEPFTMVTRALTDAVSGEEVQIRFPEESIHLFDAASEEAVHNPA